MLIIQFCSCNNGSDSMRSNDNDMYNNEVLEILDEKRTLSRIKEIEVTKNESGYDDIVIHSLNGTKASFYSNQPCGGPGPSYSIIASIPHLGIVFLDRTYGCHSGETSIVVSLKDGVYRELKSSVWRVDQLSVSPNGSWLVISDSDCDETMGRYCNIEILDLKNSNNCLIETKFYNDNICANKNLNWFSENGFTSQTSIGGDFGDCIYKPIKFEYLNNEWTFKF